VSGRYLADLAAVVRSSGLVVVEVDGWQTRARSSGGYSTGQPSVAMCHHTASGPSSDGWPDVEYMTYQSDIAPMANLYLQRDGTIWVMAAGATNTNGAGGPLGSVPTDSMNTRAVGIEAGNDGTGEPWPDRQQDAYLALVVALSEGYGITEYFHHREWAPDRKIDCAGPSRWASSGSWDYDAFRADLGPGPVPPPEEGDEMAYGPYLIQSTGKSGDPAGTVYACDRQYMTLRRLRDEQALGGYRWQLRTAGARAPELEDGAPIMPVDDLNAFGVVIS
jgi:N-acetylmuramoyl-L-alanine amidase